MVVDVVANRWTFIGQGTTPTGWGRLAPRSRTAVEWEDTGSTAPCDAYPRTDAYVPPSLGIRNGSFTVGKLVTNTVIANGCPSQATYFGGWAHYHLGT